MKPSTVESRYILWAWLVIILGTIQDLCYAWAVRLTSDQTQMLSKGVKLSEWGIWTHTGNLVTGGGHVPGALSTALVGFPLMLVDHPMAPQVLVMLFHLASLYLLNEALKESFSWPQRLIFICLFWLSPWKAYNGNLLWNPSYLFFAASLHLYTANRLQKKPQSFWLSFWHVFSIGFTFQLHVSSIILVIMSGYLLFRRTLKVNWWGIITSTALIALTLVPFFIEAMSSKDLLPLSQLRGEYESFYGAALVKVGPIIKAILYWPRYSSFFFPAIIFKPHSFDFSSIEPRWLMTFVKHGSATIRYAVGVPSLLLSIWGFVWLIKKFFKFKSKKFFMDSFLDNYIFSAVLAFILSAAISPMKNFSYWHLLLILPVANIAFCQFLFVRFASFSQQKVVKVMVAVVTYLLVYNASTLVFPSRKISLKNNMNTSYSEWKKEFMRNFQQEEKTK